MPEPLLRAQSLCFLGLGPFNLELQPGERISLSGPSGSGKSQLLRALTDLIPYTGVLQVKGRPAHELPPQELRRLIGLLPAETAWWHEQVAPHFTRLQPATLAQVKLPSEAAGWPVARLSTGEKQRLALLRLLENRPQALLLDEPTSALDPASAEAVEALILDYCHTHQAALLWVGHSKTQCSRMALRHLNLSSQGLVEAQ